MTHIARGVDKHGIMNIDVIVNGEVPQLPPKATIVVLPYVEDYIQTGPGWEFNLYQLHFICAFHVQVIDDYIIYY